jgi:purine-binding chemotaxis protein CheW
MDNHVTHTEDLFQLVSFVVDEEEFGVNILKVQEIIRPMAITRVPNAPSFVEGVINLRGRIIPVVDLRKRFGFPPLAHDDSTRIVVVELHDKVIGFMTDAVKEVIRIEQNVMEPPPDLAVGIDAHYIQNVAKLDDRLLIMLDLDAVISQEESEALDPLKEAA